jgi:hypothetical protein
VFLKLSIDLDVNVIARSTAMRAPPFCYGPVVDILPIARTGCPIGRVAAIAARIVVCIRFLPFCTKVLCSQRSVKEAEGVRIIGGAQCFAGAWLKSAITGHRNDRNRRD